MQTEGERIKAEESRR